MVIHGRGTGFSDRALCPKGCSDEGAKVVVSDAMIYKRREETGQDVADAVVVKPHVLANLPSCEALIQAAVRQKYGRIEHPLLPMRRSVLSGEVEEFESRKSEAQLIDVKPVRFLPTRCALRLPSIKSRDYGSIMPRSTANPAKGFGEKFRVRFDRNGSGIRGAMKALRSRLREDNTSA